MSQQESRQVRVWDAPTRLFHWVLVLLLVFLWYSAGDGDLMDWHMRAGYAVLALVLFRILWGFFGSPWSRFRAFVSSPREALAYGWRFLRGHQPIFLSHNPLGGWMVLVMLGALLVQAGTGLFATDDITVRGPLRELVSSAMARQLTRIHGWTFDLLLILVVLHLLAVLAHRLRGEPLVLAMITGRKKSPDPGAPDLPYAPWWKAVLVFVLAAGGVYLVVT